MSYSCKILLDSISPTGKRITTFEITFPRIVLAEFNTHRMFSRNSASSRAIPFEKQIQRIANDPFIPEKFPINAKGMQPQKYITKQDDNYEDYARCWKNVIEASIQQARLLNELGIHKQILNRLLEPFQYHTVICTATEFDNFFKLRTHPDAQYEIRRIADLMYEAYHAPEGSLHSRTVAANYQPCNDRSYIATKKQNLKVGEWHCPLVYEEDFELINLYVTDNLQTLLREHNLKCNTLSQEYDYVKKISISLRKRISTARCARISYLTHDGKRSIEKDLELFERLKTSGHWSPFEHVATPHFWNQKTFTEALEAAGRPARIFKVEPASGLVENPDLRSGNFIGWRQYRKEFADENCINFRKEN